MSPGLVIALLGAAALVVAANTSTKQATGSLADIKHIVLFMQENRAFDHYFGTMAGVRGFADPNVQVNPGGKTTFDQVVTPAISKATTVLQPFYASYLGGTWPNATQCMTGGDNGWGSNHGAYHGGLNDYWAVANNPYSLAYHKRADIPVHFGIAEAFTVADMYQSSVIASTNPNRVYWNSGSVNIAGGPQSPSQGGPVLDNSAGTLTWTTIMEHLQNAGVAWQFYQNPTDEYAEDILTQFTNFKFKTPQPNNPLYTRGVARGSNNSMAAFYEQAMAGTLPQVSWIIADQELSEHPPWLPQDGGWIQGQVVEAVTKGASFQNTALIISYDEDSRWYDHVTPYHSPQGTPGEWLQDPTGQFGYTFDGPGYRIPMYIVSPWTQGGNVFTEHADHSSQILFLEKWAQANGYNVQTQEINAWRRANMSNLVNAFNFNSPNLTPPTIPLGTEPPKDAAGNHIGREVCQSTYPKAQPPIPFGLQSSAPSLAVENGFKTVRGQLTEGRYLTFEMNGYGLAVPTTGDYLTATPTSASHSSAAQRWILHQLNPGGKVFNLESAVTGGQLMGVTINDLGNGTGYSLGYASKFIQITAQGGVGLASTAAGFKVFSVTYN